MTPMNVNQSTKHRVLHTKVFFLFIIFLGCPAIVFSKNQGLTESQYKRRLEHLVRITSQNIKNSNTAFQKTSRLVPSNQKYLNKQYVKQKLRHMAEIDQMIRKNIWGSSIVQDMMRENIFFRNNKSLVKLTEKIDWNNTNELKKILSIYPWFKISEFGKSAVNDAFLVIQHSPDIDLQYKILFFLDHLPSNEIDLEQYALLYDRLCTTYPALGIKQRYGTQVIASSNERLKLYPYEGTWFELNQRRKGINLDSMEAYLTRIKQSTSLHINQ